MSRDMYFCTNCGAPMEELYRRYCPTVLKLLECEKCGSLADKYIEYDPAIIFVDLILIQKQAYRHFLYNSERKSYWKLLIVLCLAESFRIHSLCNENSIEMESVVENSNRNGTCNFHWTVCRTAFSMLLFLTIMIVITEIKWRLLNTRKPNGYSISNLIRAIVVGSSGKLLGFLGIVWKKISTGPHYMLIEGYTCLCLVTAYSVVCNSGKLSSSFILAIALITHAFFLSTVTNALNY